MRLGIVGRGYWGDTYARTLRGMGIDFTQYGRDWERQDGLIIACKSEFHFEVAQKALSLGIPALIEKPVTLDEREAWGLCGYGGIAFAGHTRLYSPAWRRFKRPANKVVAYAGGVNETNPDPLWNWIPHLAAMALDVGARDVDFRVSKEWQYLRFIADGREFWDVETIPSPLEVLVGEFVEAIRKGEPDNSGLRLGAKTIAITKALRGLCSLEAHVDLDSRGIARGCRALDEEPRGAGTCVRRDPAGGSEDQPEVARPGNGNHQRDVHDQR